MKSHNNCNYVLPMERVIEVPVFQRNGRFYVKTRDIADLLQIKQPFEFCADLKRYLGTSCVLKGKDAAFIYEDDKSQERTTFINITKLLKYLRSADSFHNKMSEKKKVIAMLSKLNSEKENFFQEVESHE